jgi:riboflavin kinase/FMN adenylyltransferase
MRMLRLTAEDIERSLAGERVLRSQDTGPSALALGSFDGVHLGHQALIRSVREAKERHGLRNCGLFTFRRHPSLVLGGRDRPFLLTTWPEKLALLNDAGLDVVVAASFSSALAQLDYRRFVREFLVDDLGMRHFVAGYDVHLGAGREGNAQTLAALGDELGYTLEVVDPTTVGGRTVSSSAIRTALEAGEVAEAALQLGRPYALWGRVTPGDGRGRKIGFPTANVEPLDDHKLLPAPGVYAVRVQLPDDILSSDHARRRIHGGMLNFGRVPTFHTDGLVVPRIEVHVFDFVGDLRGCTVKVEWLARLRDERRFGGVEELISQLRRDEACARDVVAATQWLVQ